MIQVETEKSETPGSSHPSEETDGIHVLVTRVSVKLAGGYGWGGGHAGQRELW